MEQHTKNKKSFSHPLLQAVAPILLLANYSGIFTAGNHLVGNMPPAIQQKKQKQTY
jgi:hypothetical protein